MKYDNDPFIAEILADPIDDGPRLIYADWLEEQGDPRARFLRLEVKCTEMPPPDVAEELGELTETARKLDREWVGLAGKRYDIILMGVGNNQKKTVDAVRTSCRWSLLVSKRIVDLAPVKIMKAVSWVDVTEFRQRLFSAQPPGPDLVRVVPSPSSDYSDDPLELANELAAEFECEWNK